MLFDLLAQRRQEVLSHGWRDVPAWVFCSEAGTPLEERNVERTWYRVRRRAQKRGVRPFKLHTARHTYASLALASGKSVRWVAEQLGHANPELTLRTYAHVLREEESDLSFAEFDSPGRPYTAPASDADAPARDADSVTTGVDFGIVERETGLEPATLSLGS